MGVLDYVLNRCTIREIDALEAAVERRRRDLTSQSGIISLDPERAARDMTGAVNKSINASMDGIRETFRNFAEDIIRKEAPELTDEQMRELVDSWIPQNMSLGAGGVTSSTQNPSAANASNYRGLSQKGLVNGVPRDAMFEMVSQFVDYSVGAMPVSVEATLRDEIGDWATLYWKKFPRPLQELIQQFLSGAMSGEEFGYRLQSMLQ